MPRQAGSCRLSQTLGRMHPRSFSLALVVHLFILAFTLGTAVAASQNAKPQEMRLFITESGQYVLAGKPLTLSELREKFRELKSQRKPIELHVTSSPRTKYENVAAAMQIIQEEGLGRIGFITEPIPPEVVASSPSAR